MATIFGLVRDAMTRMEFASLDIDDIIVPCKIRSGNYEKWELISADGVQDIPDVQLNRKEFAVTREAILPKEFAIKFLRKPKFIVREVR